MPPPLAPAPGTLPDGFDGPRACGPYDLAGTLDLINLVFRTQPATGSPRPPDMGWEYTNIYNPENLANVRIVCHRGRPVSAVGILSTTVRTPRGTISVGGINAVATHPDYRRLGLATITLEDAQATMRAAGLHVGLLSTGIPNYYRKLGWERAGQQRTFTFDRRNVTYLPPGDYLAVTEDWQPHLEELNALRGAGALGAARTLPDFARLLERKVDRVFVASRNGAVVAYAALKDASVREYAGAPQDVAALLHSLFPQAEHLAERTTARPPGLSGQFELTVVTPAPGTAAIETARAAGTETETPGTLPALLLQRGIPSALTYLGMIAILDAPRLFTDLGIPAEIERRGATWRLTHGGRPLDLSDGELAKTIFGPERHPDLAPDLFPLGFFQWPLDRV